MKRPQLISKATFVVVDVETTGMSATDDRITEIAMMKVQDGVLVDEFSTLVNPLVTIPAFITSMTGIDNVMVLDAPPAREVVPFIAEFLGDAVFVAHNAAFDWGFVSHTARRERGIELDNQRLCTVKLSGRILPHLTSKSLGPVAEHLDITIPERHRASGDAYATALVLVKFLSYLQKKENLSTVEELLKFQYGRSSHFSRT
ncbi:MAG: exonuclease domain-containing protein [Ignavibacteriales bacterium]|nr:exonuclease domain-containing protein [Ignavibacteriales bacterium]